MAEQSDTFGEASPYGTPKTESPPPAERKDTFWKNGSPHTTHKPDAPRLPAEQNDTSWVNEAASPEKKAPVPQEDGLSRLRTSSEMKDALEKLEKLLPNGEDIRQALLDEMDAQAKHTPRNQGIRKTSYGGSPIGDAIVDGIELAQVAGRTDPQANAEIIKDLSEIVGPRLSPERIKAKMSDLEAGRNKMDSFLPDGVPATNDTLTNLARTQHNGKTQHDKAADILAEAIGKAVDVAIVHQPLHTPSLAAGQSPAHTGTQGTPPYKKATAARHSGSQ